MYFEAHIIVRPPFSPAFVRDISRGQGWWGSVLKQESSGEEMAGDFILTTRDEKEESIRGRIETLVRVLKGGGANVRRYKIEHATLDSNVEDELGLIDPDPDEESDG